ncbi:MAG: NrpR regulatory domain-containing protein [ANME-2 cluster archaeon]|jgi:repressor of nif and glnA expression|nr:NrpR regulatory domain-containing protein [ANME-2 cluster archaeon]
MTEFTTQRTIIEILKSIYESDEPIGARLIADKLDGIGFSIGERGVRYHLKILDENEFTKRVGYSGRVITKKGISEINNALVGDRLGFVISRIHELLYNTTFDPIEKTGNIIINLSVMDKDDFETNMELIHAVIQKGYTVSPRHHIFKEGAKVSNITIPRGSVGIATICSLTIDGVLLKHGIPIETKYGGIIEIDNEIPVRFTDLISYTGTSIDPIKIFLSKQMTDVTSIMEHGSGLLLGNLREAPIIAYENIMNIISKLNNADIGGVIGHIHAGDTVLSAPITPGRIGIPIYAGVNPLAAVVEKGFEVSTYPVNSIMDYEDMDEIF